MGSLIQRAKDAVLIVMMALAAVYGYLYKRQSEALYLAQAAATLPPDVIAKYTMENRKLVQLVRDLDGKVKSIQRYVPAEGRIDVITRRQEEALKRYNDLLDRLGQAKTPEEATKIRSEIERARDDLNKPPEVHVKDWGLTSRFGFGIVVSPGLKTDLLTSGGDKLTLPVSPALDWKWAYWRRYSAILQINPGYIGPGFTRHVDDFTPRWLHADNIELGLSGGIEWPGARGSVSP